MTPITIPLPADYTVIGDTRSASENVTSPINEYCHKLLNLCSTTGLRIMNCRVGMDKGVGKYTCEAPNGSSVVDNMVITQKTCSSIVFNAAVEKQTPHSDHNILCCRLQTNQQLLTTNKLKTRCHKREKLVRNILKVYQ